MESATTKMDSTMNAHAASSLLRLIFLASFIDSVGGCVSLFECDVNEISSAYSPKKVYVARIYVKDCGATTASVVHVAVERSNSLNGPPNDVFIYEGSRTDVRIAWIGEDELLITYGTGKVYKNVTSIATATIRYLQQENGN